MNKKIIGVFSVLTLSTFCCGFASAAEKAVGVPNPMVSYDNVVSAKAAAGFQPLYLPSISGYHVSNVWVIAGDVIDIEYTSDIEPVSKFRLRTARCTELMNESTNGTYMAGALGTSNEGGISGIYGAKWQQEKINGLPVSIAEIPKENTAPVDYAAHWTHNNMLFSASSENMTYREFWRLLEHGLVELSLNYY